MSSTSQFAHSTQEAAEAIQALSEVDWLRLDRAAQFQVFCFPRIDADDLLNETFRRILEGSRHWKTGVPFLVFFYNAMRSIADEWRQDEKERHDITEADLPPRPDGESSTLDGLAVAGNADPAKALYIARLIQEIEADFVQTDADLSFLLGTGQGMTANETQREFGLTEQEYGAARKRWERWLVNRYPKGMKQ